MFSIAKHLLFREHNAVISTLVRQRNDAGCFPVKAKKRKALNQKALNQKAKQSLRKSVKWYVILFVFVPICDHTPSTSRPEKEGHSFCFHFYLPKTKRTACYIHRSLSVRSFYLRCISSVLHTFPQQPC